MIEAIENVGRCQRSDHIKKAINYVKILLEKQAEPNARDEWGSGSALHYAIWCGQLEVVKLLLDTDACNIEADTGTAHSNHPFRCSVLGESVAASHALLTHEFRLRGVHTISYAALGASMQPLMQDCSHIFMLHAKHRCFVAGQYFRGYDQYIRPIHMAAYEARPDLMRLLIASGASIDAPDRKGRTPVQCVLASSFFDGESLMGKPTKTTPKQRLTLQVTDQLQSHIARHHLALNTIALAVLQGRQHAFYSCTMQQTRIRQPALIVFAFLLEVGSMASVS